MRFNLNATMVLVVIYTMDYGTCLVTLGTFLILIIFATLHHVHHLCLVHLLYAIYLLQLIQVLLLCASLIFNLIPMMAYVTHLAYLAM